MSRKSSTNSISKPVSNPVLMSHKSSTNSITKNWSGKEQFLTKLSETEYFMKQDNMFRKFKNIKKCKICHEEVGTGQFKLGEVTWNDSLTHYVKKHNLRPSAQFIDTIYRYQIPMKTQMSRLESKSKIFVKNNIKYIKISENQLQIIDALMKHGGYHKRYVDKSNTKLFRYSEHAGFLHFTNNGLDKITISCRSNVVDKDDNEIYFVKSVKEMLNYEYIFHTHPPTPKPGGRVTEGILYEFPSISDLFHFIYHYNNGSTYGSIVVAPEGLYNIRKLTQDMSKIKVNEDEMFKTIADVYLQVQNKFIDKYGSLFNSYTFFSKIAQDIEFIDIINGALEKYELHIDYFPRVKDSRGSWVLGTIYLPVYE